MRIGVDLRHVPAGDDPGAGVSHASIELTEALEKQSKEYGIEIVRLYSPKRAWAFRRVVKRVDALLVPSGSVPPCMPVPCYPWVHDVAIFSHPEWFSQSRIRRWMTTRIFLRGVKMAPHVFAVSEDTKRELMKLSGLPSDRITVTYQGIKPITPGDRKPYALILGSINPRKNVEFIERLWNEIPNGELIVAGEPRMHFDDVQRDKLVRHASVLLLPSLHEGFGRTALEAMSAGVPVIASKRGAIPEVVGDAGLLLEPDDREGWVKGIRAAFQGTLDGSKGPERSRRFTWDRTAAIILAKLAKT